MKDIVIESMLVLARYVREEYEKKKRLASGDFGRSLEVVEKGWRFQLLGNHYAKYMVEGREPGGIPPVDVIEKWIIQKPGLPASMKKDSRKTAWAIAIKIGKKGIQIPNEYYKGDFLDVAIMRWKKDELPKLKNKLGEKEIRSIYSEIPKILVNIENLMI